MKYYLVFGYQTIEKWRDFGRIQLFLNEKLVEDFPADNEKSNAKIFHNAKVHQSTNIEQYIENSKQDKKTMFMTDYVYKHFQFPPDFYIFDQLNYWCQKKNITPKNYIKDKVGNAFHFEKYDIHPQTLLNRVRAQQEKSQKDYESWIEANKEKSYDAVNYQPSALKIIEINSDNLDNEKINHLQIVVLGGPSNHTNGFVSKKNMISIFPVYFFPKKIMDINFLSSLYEKAKKMFLLDYELNSFPYYISKQNTAKSTPVQWPGPNYFIEDGKEKFLGQPIGSNQIINFYIHKKHGIYSLHNTKTAPQGHWQLNLCFLHIYKRLVDFIQTVA